MQFWLGVAAGLVTNVIWGVGTYVVTEVADHWTDPTGCEVTCIGY